jgi:3-isopropylmalate dehydrogenase
MQSRRNIEYTLTPRGDDMSATPYEIAVLPGDGIGPEVVAAAQTVLDAAANGTGLQLAYTTYEAGAGLYEREGVGITEETMTAIGAADAILLGAMGLPRVRRPNGTEITPQIDIREHYELFASLRPARLLPGIAGALREGDVDMLVIRETTEGLFAGRHDPHPEDPEQASDRMTITRTGSERLFEVAFAEAERRRARTGRARVTLLDKSNVLTSFAFFRAVFDEVAQRHPDVEADHLYIDAACMMMVLDPERFDVVVTENQFGDIASELAAGISGGLGMAPSADIGHDHGVFQPCHGTAPDLAGRGLANPVATILSAALLLDWLAGRHNDPAAARAAQAVREAVEATTASGTVTPEVGGSATTQEVAAAVAEAVTSALTGSGVPG